MARRLRCRCVIPDKTAPLVISGWALMVWILMALGTSIVSAGVDRDRRR